MRKIFVTGIGTDAGKTMVSAVLVQALKADYWKPLQTGSEYGTDTDKVKKLVTNSTSVFHPEAYCLKAPVAPYASAKAEGVEIKFEDIQIPNTNNTLIIEGAGGLYVPITEHRFVIDLIKKLEAETVLVVQNYLGSINHTLLSLKALKNENINVIGIIINGVENNSSEKIILEHSPFPLLGRIHKESDINSETIKKYETVFSTI